ncbi:Mitochondrial transcription factor 1 [Orbilia blumenaviensis]|uniref:rRNA adenine N(6)-methyltransferase n=1 Tax=Orbilia blumenaviensis TaxID=1796055 RepID=A0AAV9VNB3_9PEZI
MRAATRLKTVVADRALLSRHSFPPISTSTTPCQWRPRDYSTELSPRAPNGIDLTVRRKPGRPKRTPEEAALALLEKQKKKDEKIAAIRGTPYKTVEALREELKKMYDDTGIVFMKPMRRPVGRPKKVVPPEEPSSVKRGRKVGSKNKPKEVKPKPKEVESKPKLSRKRFGPKYPTRHQKAKMAVCAGVPIEELVFGIPKDLLDTGPAPRTPRIPSEKRAAKATARRNESEDAGRPKKYGPELPSKIIIDQGVEKRVYLRPGRARLFYSEEERFNKEIRQTQAELAAHAKQKRRAELSHFGVSQDGKKRRRKTPLSDEIAEKLAKQEFDRPTGPKAYEISELTRTAREFLAKRKEEAASTEEEPEWEYLLDEEGHPIIPAKKKSVGGNTRQNPKELASAKPKKWDGTTYIPSGSEEKWRTLTPKKAETVSPTIHSLLQSGIPQLKPPTEKSLVIGEQKCADIFQRFDFSEFEGCDIIDFNPGYGIYSRELNKAVKPSKHILLEHEEGFVPFLEQTCTDPSFEIIQNDFYDWNTFDKLIKEGKINPKKMKFEDGVNKTLLVTGMLHKEVKGDRFMAQILDSLAQRDWVFRYGRIKFLVWLDEEMVARYLPRTFGRRNRAAVMVEAFTDVREMASPPPIFTWADHRFFFRMDVWNRPGHTPNKQDVATGVKYANQLTYITMPREPPPVIFETGEYWPPLRWAQTTLLDLTPKLPLPYLNGDVPDSEPWKFFNLFLTSSFLSRHTTIRQVLSKIGEGAEQMLETEDSLKKFPELPEKHAVHVSVEELVELSQAYEFWPWRSEDPFLGTDMRLSRPKMLDELEDAQIVL